MAARAKKTDEGERDGAPTAATAAKAAAILGAVFTLFALGLFGWRTAWSTAAGAAIAVGNLVALRAIVTSLIRAPEEEEKEETDDDAPAATPDHKGEGRRGGVAWGIFAVLKILLLFGGIFVLLTIGLVDPIPLAVGYGVLPLGIVASSFRSSLSPRR